MHEGLLDKSGYDHAEMLEFLLFLTCKAKNPGFRKQTGLGSNPSSVPY